MSLLKYCPDIGDQNENLERYIYNEDMLKILSKNRVKTLREIQINAIKQGLFFKKNFLVSAPSGSGKTLIGELAIANNLFSKSGRGVYLVPYKAIAVEKYHYFKRLYKEYNFKTVLSIGDSEVEEEEILNADILVTTYEKLDSIIRNRELKEKWLDKVTTIVIDEVHVLGDEYRGFKLESLIIRIILNRYKAQIICLSATISNPEVLAGWLNNLSSNSRGNPFILIKSDVRPVKLDYKIDIAHNKDAYIRRRLKECIQQGGQVLVFVSTRKSSKGNAEKFRTTTKKYIDDVSKRIIEDRIKEVKKIDGNSPTLHNFLRDGIAYHNAGLIAAERTLIEELFIQKHIRAICCTTTLAAGVNTPARLVILRDFKKRTELSRHIEKEINDGLYASNYKELPGNVRGYFIPFSNNQVFQLLGRAGRPGMDLIGQGVIAVKNEAEFEWVENNYFYKIHGSSEYDPKYNPVESSLNKIGALREQVLLVCHQYDGISIQNLKNFFDLSYFSYTFNNKINLSNYLLLDNLDIKSIVELHSSKKIMDYASEHLKNIVIQNMNSNTIDFLVTYHQNYLIRFNIDSGIMCSCNKVVSPEKLKEHHYIRNNYEFCPHVIGILDFIIKYPKKKISSQNNQNIECCEVKKYLDEIIPFALKSERIVDFLIRTGFLIRDKNELGQEKFYCTDLGTLTIRLYLKPIEMIFLRNLIQNNDFTIQEDLIEGAWGFLENQGRYKSNTYKFAIRGWIQEENVETIISRSEKMSGGDFFNFKNDIVRVLGHIESVAQFYDKSEIADLAKTLSKRVEFGIKEELFDLVLRIKDVGRKRGRILFNVGFERASDVYNSNPREISEKTSFSPLVAKKIYENSIEIKKRITNL